MEEHIAEMVLEFAREAFPHLDCYMMDERPGFWVVKVRDGEELVYKYDGPRLRKLGLEGSAA